MLVMMRRRCKLWLVFPLVFFLLFALFWSCGVYQCGVQTVQFIEQSGPGVQENIPSDKGEAKQNSRFDLGDNLDLGAKDDTHAHVASPDSSHVSLDSSGESILPIIDLSVISPSLANRSLEFLPDYKNPCWKEPIPQKNPYVNNLYNADRRTKDPFRELAEHWQQRVEAGDKWRLRCLGYFYMVGQPKCGTSDLYFKLVMHPEVERNPIKEPHWWAHGRIGRGVKGNKPVPIDDYVDLYDGAAVKMFNEEKDGYHNIITGEASTTTLWANFFWRNHSVNANLSEPKYLTAHYIHAIQPSAKIIIMLRDPTPRLFSDYIYFPGPRKSPQSFHDLVTRSVDAFDSCDRKRGIRSCVYDPKFKYMHLGFGLYYPYVKDWLDVFPRDQVLIIKFEEYAKNRVEVLNHVLDFLGAPPFPEEIANFIKHDKISNSRTSRRLGMLPKTKVLLDQFHQKYNSMLADLVQDDRFLWR